MILMLGNIFLSSIRNAYVKKLNKQMLKLKSLSMNYVILTLTVPIKIVLIYRLKHICLKTPTFQRVFNLCEPF